MGKGSPHCISMLRAVDWDPRRNVFSGIALHFCTLLSPFHDQLESDKYDSQFSVVLIREDRGPMSILSKIHILRFYKTLLK